MELLRKTSSIACCRDYSSSVVVIISRILLLHALLRGCTDAAADDGSHHSPSHQYDEEAVLTVPSAAPMPAEDEALLSHQLGEAFAASFWRNASHRAAAGISIIDKAAEIEHESSSRSDGVGHKQDARSATHPTIFGSKEQTETHEAADGSGSSAEGRDTNFQGSRSRQRSTGSKQGVYYSRQGDFSLHKQGDTIVMNMPLFGGAESEVVKSMVRDAMEKEGVRAGMEGTRTSSARGNGQTEPDHADQNTVYDYHEEDDEELELEDDSQPETHPRQGRGYDKDEDLSKEQGILSEEELESILEKVETLARNFMNSVDDSPEHDLDSIGRHLQGMEHGNMTESQGEDGGEGGGKGGGGRRHLLNTWDENSITFLNDAKALQRIVLEEYCNILTYSNPFSQPTKWQGASYEVALTSGACILISEGLPWLPETYRARLECEQSAIRLKFRPPRFTYRYVTGAELDGPECRYMRCYGIDTFHFLPGTPSTECVDQAGFLWRLGDNIIFPLDNSEFAEAINPTPEDAFDAYYDYGSEGDYDYEYYYDEDSA